MNLTQEQIGESMKWYEFWPGPTAIATCEGSLNELDWMKGQRSLCGSSRTHCPHEYEYDTGSIMPCPDPNDTAIFKAMVERLPLGWSLTKQEASPGVAEWMVYSWLEQKIITKGETAIEALVRVGLVAKEK